MTLAGLVGFAVASLATLALDYFVLGVFIPPALVIAVVLGSAAGLVAAGLRWAPLVGAVIAALVLVGTFTQGVGAQRLLSPENPWLFASTVLMVVGGAAAVAAGTTATYQQVARRGNSPPRRRRE